MKGLGRTVLSLAVVLAASAVNPGAGHAESGDDVEEVVVTGYIRAWVPTIPTVAEFQLSVGNSTYTHENVYAAAGGTLTLAWRNNTAVSPPEVERVLCPGGGSRKRAGVKLRITGLSAGTEVAASLETESATGGRQVVTLAPGTADATASGVHAAVCQKL